MGYVHMVSLDLEHEEILPPMTGKPMSRSHPPPDRKSRPKSMNNLPGEIRAAGSWRKLHFWKRKMVGTKPSWLWRMALSPLSKNHKFFWDIESKMFRCRLGGNALVALVATRYKPLTHAGCQIDKPCRLHWRCPTLEPYEAFWNSGRISWNWTVPNWKMILKVEFLG